MNTGKRLTQEEAIHRINEICEEKNLEFTGFNNEENMYTNHKVKLILKCNKCGFVWDTLTYNKSVSRSSSNCPKCNKKMRHTKEELYKLIDKKCKELDYTFLGFLTPTPTVNDKISLKCNKCGEKWDTTTIANFFKNDRKSHTCGRKNPSSMPPNFIKEDVLSERIKKKIENSNLEFIGFKGDGGEKNLIILLKCKICGEVLTYRYNTIIYSKNVKCKKCEFYRKTSNKQSIILIKEKCLLLDYTFLGFCNDKNRYDGKNTRLKLRCNKCGYEWNSTTYYNFIHGVIKCRGCNISWKMEKEVRYFLKKNNIIFDEQKKIDWLKNKSLLSLDFYLPEYNIFIECQGRQHFIPVDKFGGKYGFKETQERDKIKYELCLKNGLKPIFYCTNKKFDTFLGEELIRNEEELIKKIENYGKN